VVPLGLKCPRAEVKGGTHSPLEWTWNPWKPAGRPLGHGADEHDVPVLGELDGPDGVSADVFQLRAGRDSVRPGADLESQPE
jgi:hypothetical protein